MSMPKKQSQKKRQEGAAGDSCNKELDTMGYEIKQLGSDKRNRLKILGKLGLNFPLSPTNEPH